MLVAEGTTRSGDDEAGNCSLAPSLYLTKLVLLDCMKTD